MQQEGGGEHADVPPTEEDQEEIPATPKVEMSQERIENLQKRAQWIFDPNRSKDVPEEERVKQVFDLFDTEKDGVIDVLEFWEMCVGLGKPIEIDMAAEALRKLDVNCDGVVDIDEFSTWWIPFEARLLERLRLQQEAAAAEEDTGEMTMEQPEHEQTTQSAEGGDGSVPDASSPKEREHHRSPSPPPPEVSEVDTSSAAAVVESMVRASMRASMRPPSPNPTTSASTSRIARRSPRASGQGSIIRPSASVDAPALAPHSDPVPRFVSSITRPSMPSQSLTSLPSLPLDTHLSYSSSTSPQPTRLTHSFETPPVRVATALDIPEKRISYYPGSRPAAFNPFYEPPLSASAPVFGNAFPESVGNSPELPRLKEEAIDRLNFDSQFAYIHRNSTRIDDQFAYIHRNSARYPDPQEIDFEQMSKNSASSPALISPAAAASLATLTQSTRRTFQAKPLPPAPVQPRKVDDVGMTMRRADERRTDDALSLIMPGLVGRASVETTELWPPAALPRTSGRVSPSKTSAEPLKQRPPAITAPAPISGTLPSSPRSPAVPPLDLTSKNDGSPPSLLRKLSRALSPRKSRTFANSADRDVPPAASAHPKLADTGRSASAMNLTTSPRSPGRTAGTPTLTRGNSFLNKSPRSPRPPREPSPARPTSPARCVAVHGVAESLDFELEHVLKGGRLTRAFLVACTRCGYLMKFGAGWQRRWAVLRSHVLFYFGSRDDLKPRSMLLLTDAEVTIIDEAKYRFLLTCNVSYTGNQRFEKRVFSFGAGSRDDMLEWVEALRLAAALVVARTGKAL